MNEELVRIAEELELQEMAKAHLLEWGSGCWNVTEKGWQWMAILARLTGMKLHQDEAAARQFEEAVANSRSPLLDQNEADDFTGAEQ